MCQRARPWFRVSGHTILGVADNRGSGAGIVRRFVDRRFDVIAYDSRAHGDSGGDACTYGYFEKEDLRRVLDTVPPGPVVLIGTSLGAAVALQAAAALARVQRRARNEGMALKVFDGYRPVRATLAMVEWAERTGQQALLRDGYIASRSRHNLGLAVDLTLIGGDGQELDMGTPFDTFSSAAHTANATGEVASNRRLLVLLMQAEGFTNYEKEWWHFTYDVPNPLRFDLVIR